ncbi:phosphatidylinositol N-acetylglucosaminyltransferase subunit P-like [Gigantopelta aegis]|uniref:phosphatidylinositol N-acetylglucosaminyltransferase subunit P-like n=1 Tax=Gigantopelta aegis TaxID=1735272 RepID=UPI001B88B2A9|nr:phosphatidylinositol N-acetylglucosaminyltransferase subunit P-like [Gigantopelta aegis]XP_041378350.1 phosphatidylinositol N-acetylglucosaminyltransferase subunit P-like [Gigantopelta aegis]XP_041378351.1 phosphatidylinositol N-acetylglucosaminyltransferase subunit P-like [Gigantopelta aegis]
MTEHSPSPTPERAVNGFVLYLMSIVALGLYVVWAYVPDSWLHALGLTYWPQKYWAIAIPVYLCLVFLLGYPLYMGLTLMNTPPLTSTNTITDDFSREVKQDIPKNAIPPIGDMSISDVNRLMYLNNPG